MADDRKQEKRTTISVVSDIPVKDGKLQTRSINIALPAGSIVGPTQTETIKLPPEALEKLGLKGKAK